jgi:hypothetical protein
VPEVHLATLELTAPPEAAVFLDDIRAGTVNPAGTFSKDIEPGSHTVTVRKSGYEEFKVTREFKAGEPIHLAPQMHGLQTGLAIHVVPGNARITIRRDTDIYTPANGQTQTLAVGSYVVTATADGFDQKSDTIEVENGKLANVEWILKKSTVTTIAPAGWPFTDQKSWSSTATNWKEHRTDGLTFFNGPSGSHVFDILKRKTGLFHGVKRTIFVADYRGAANYVQYGLDGKTLFKVVHADGRVLQEQHLDFGGDNAEFVRLNVELAPDSFTIKNRAGAVIDRIEKSDIGKFGFSGEVTLNMSR